jgi:hypothetical protein
MLATDNKIHKTYGRMRPLLTEQYINISTKIAELEMEKEILEREKEILEMAELGIKED